MNTPSTQLTLPPRRLLLLLLVTLAVAAVITVCFVLPAEFRKDPTGIGKLTGLTRLAGPERIAIPAAGTAATASAVAAGGEARYYDTPWRADAVEIPLEGDSGKPAGNELEYKVRVKAGAAVSYSWAVEGLEDPGQFYFDMHGEGGGKVGPGESKIVQFRQATGLKSAGMFVAPIDGIYGWYLQNQSEAPVKVHLKLAGFYELLDIGTYGNEAYLEAQPLSAP